tara:strand:- start:116 stop:529 length:414 start_codon:yes stop_codon:yes gene_type:complete
MNTIIGAVRSDCVTKDSSVPSSPDDDDDDDPPPPLDKHFLPEITETTKHVARGMFIFFVNFIKVIGEKSSPHEICTIFILYSQSFPPSLSSSSQKNKTESFNERKRLFNAQHVIGVFRNEKNWWCKERRFSLGCIKP